MHLESISWLVAPVGIRRSAVFASALCLASWTSYPESGIPKGLWFCFRNVFFQPVMFKIDGGVWFLICAKDILHLINNHWNQELPLCTCAVHVWLCVCVCRAIFALSRGNLCELTAQLSVPGPAVGGLLGNAVPSDKQAVHPFSLTTQPRGEEISTSNTSAHTSESTLTFAPVILWWPLSPRLR